MVIEWMPCQCRAMPAAAGVAERPTICASLRTMRSSRPVRWDVALVPDDERPRVPAIRLHARLEGGRGRDLDPPAALPCVRGLDVVVLDTERLERPGRLLAEDDAIGDEPDIAPLGRASRRDLGRYASLARAGRRSQDHPAAAGSRRAA